MAITEGAYLNYNAQHCYILRVHGGYALLRLPNGKQHSVSEQALVRKGCDSLPEADFVERGTMPIKGLTTSNEGRLPYLGVLRKGGERQTKVRAGQEFQTYGQDLEYFRFTWDDADVVERFTAIFGEQPSSVTITLPFGTTEENFEAWKEAWGASGLKHRCDGETMTRWQMPDGSYSNDPKPCASGCKEVGRLKVFIRALGRMALVTVLTSSKYDIVNIHGALKDLENRCGNLAGIPFILRRKKTKISSLEKGKRVSREKYLIHIEPEPSWSALQLQAMADAALPVSSHLALPPAPEPEPDDDDEFEMEEFAPIIEGEVTSTPTTNVLPMKPLASVANEVLKAAQPTDEELRQQAEAEGREALIADIKRVTNNVKFAHNASEWAAFEKGLIGITATQASIGQLKVAVDIINKGAANSLIVQWASVAWFCSGPLQAYLVGLICAHAHFDGFKKTQAIVGDPLLYRTMKKLTETQKSLLSWLPPVEMELRALELQPKQQQAA